MPPKVDPAEWGRKMAEAKEKARQLREQRSQVSSSAEPAVARATPREEPVSSRGGYDDVPAGPSRSSGAARYDQPAAATAGPVPYRGMVKFGGPAEPATISAPAPRGDATQAAAASAAKAQAEADSAFYSMLRSDEPAPSRGGSTRKPQWNSEFSAEPAAPPAPAYSGGGGRAAGGAGRSSSKPPAPSRPPWNGDIASDEPAGGGGAADGGFGPPETKLQRLARMRAEMGTAEVDGRVAREYAGIAPPAPQRGGGGGGRGGPPGPEDVPIRAAGRYAPPPPAAAAPSAEDLPIRAAGRYDYSAGAPPQAAEDLPIRASGSYAAPPAAADADASTGYGYGAPDSPPRGPSSGGGYSPSSPPPAQRQQPPKLALLKSKLRASSARSLATATTSEAAATGSYGGSSSAPYDDDGGVSWGGPAAVASAAPPLRAASRAAAARGGRTAAAAAAAAATPPPPSYADEYSAGASPTTMAFGRPGSAAGPYGGGGGGGRPSIRGGGGGGAGVPPMTEEQPDGQVELVPCGGCGRKFNEQALQKHAVRRGWACSLGCQREAPPPSLPVPLQKVCKKVFQSKRAAFDSKAHALPEEAKQLAAKAVSPPPKRGGAAAAAAAARGFDDDGGAGAKKGAWEDKSNALRNAMRAAREYKAAVAAGKSGADLPPPPASAPDPSLVQVGPRGSDTGGAPPFACSPSSSSPPGSAVPHLRPQLQLDGGRAPHPQVLVDHQQGGPHARLL